MSARPLPRRAGCFFRVELPGAGQAAFYWQHGIGKFRHNTTITTIAHRRRVAVRAPVIGDDDERRTAIEDWRQSRSCMALEKNVPPVGGYQPRAVVALFARSRRVVVVVHSAWPRTARC